MGELTLDGLEDGERLAADGDGAVQIGGGERGERGEERGPALRPTVEELLAGVGGQNDELGVAVAAGFLAVGREEIGPTGEQVAADVFDDGGDAVVAGRGWGGKRARWKLGDGTVGDLPEPGELAECEREVGFDGHGANVGTCRRRAKQERRVPANELAD